MIYEYPKTAEEYWKTVDTYWADLYNILVRFLPNNRLAQADHLRLIKNAELVSLFNDAWWNAPDNQSIHSIPGWHILCDLCSEAYLVQEESENTNE
jgi:hypothetical protein